MRSRPAMSETKTLIIYSTTDGHTQKICSFLMNVLEDKNHQVSLHDVKNCDGLNLEVFDKIVIGASIRYGKHSQDIYKLIKQHEEILSNKPNAFFSVNLVARKPNKNTAQGNPYVKKFLTQIPWKPQSIAIFAGKLNYPKYNVIDRMIIRLIMWITNGPTDPQSVVEFTDWEQVKAFGLKIHEM